MVEARFKRCFQIGKLLFDIERTGGRFVGSFYLGPKREFLIPVLLLLYGLDTVLGLLQLGYGLSVVRGKEVLVDHLIAKSDQRHRKSQDQKEKKKPQRLGRHKTVTAYQGIKKEKGQK